MKIFGNRLFFFSVLIIIISIFILMNFEKFRFKKFDISERIKLLFIDNSLKKNNLIAHAGGGIDDQIYTNSKEALLKSIEKGFNLIELDLIETKDKKLVAANNWKSFKEKSSCCNNNIPTLNEFKNSIILDKYTPLAAEDINKIFSENKNLILVTDKTNNFDLINSSFKFDKSRIIVEVFGQDNYFKAIKNGIKNPLYSASIQHRDKEKEFIEKYEIKMIAISSSDFIKNRNYFIELKKEKGTIIFVYTSNDHNFVNDSLGVVDAFYTDFINVNTMKCISNNCKTY